MTKYFITGATGFIGQHLRERLKGNVYLYNRDQPLDCLLSFKPDYIFHLAAEIYKESEMMDSNILLTQQLLEYSRKLPKLKAFVAIGSSSEYGRKDHPMTEEDYLDPTTMYEATKGAATLLCQAYARTYGVPVMIARPFSVYGLHEPKKRFIPTVIKNVRSKRPISLAPGVHDFIHVDDFIDGLLLLADNPLPGEIFNFGSGVQTTNRELVTTVETLLNKKAHINPIAQLHTYDSDHWVADSSKAISLGWKPKYSLTTGLQQVIENISLERDYF